MARRLAVEVLIGEEIELAFLDAVLHLAARAIDFLVKLSVLQRLVACQRGDDEARIGAFWQMLRLGHDPALAAPALEGLVAQFLEYAFGFAAFLGFGLGLGQFVCDLSFEPGVAGQGRRRSGRR